MSWARRLKRVFGVEIDQCARCRGQLKILASIEEPAVIAKILSHLQRTAPVLGEEFGDRAASRPGLLAAGSARRGPPAVVSGPTIRPVTRIGSVGTGGLNFLSVEARWV